MPIDIGASLAHYEAEGYARLGRLLSDEQLVLLRERADAIMLGQVTYPGLFFQHDAATGNYNDLEYGKGYEGPSLNYRKVEKLELDPVFRSWIESSLFRDLVASAVGGPASLYRAVLFSKSEAGGSNLPFHQDGGAHWGIDRDPVIQIWTALDDMGESGGCVELYPGSHKGGLATPLGGLIPKALVDARTDACIKLPAVAGEVMLIHPYVWHASARSQSGQRRRAFTACYLDGKTRCLRKKRAPRQFLQLWR